MLKLLNDWTGTVEVNGKSYNSVKDAISDFQRTSNEVHIVLHSASRNASKSVTDAIKSVSTAVEQKITVKKYMTQKATPDFDFMAKFNNDNPMPLRTMSGTVEKETKGMIYMKLHGQAEATVRCMRCGRTLTNPVSMKYGIGPECITKIPFIMDLNVDDVDGIKKKLVDVVWEGWIIKSAITEKEEVAC